MRPFINEKRGIPRLKVSRNTPFDMGRITTSDSQFFLPRRALRRSPSACAWLLLFQRVNLKPHFRSDYAVVAPRLPGKPAGFAPKRPNTHIIGHQFVNADWNRFT